MYSQQQFDEARLDIVRNRKQSKVRRSTVEDLSKLNTLHLNDAKRRIFKNHEITEASATYQSHKAAQVKIKSMVQLKKAQNVLKDHYDQVNAIDKKMKARLSQMPKLVVPKVPTLRSAERAAKRKAQFETQMIHLYGPDWRLRHVPQKSHAELIAERAALSRVKHPEAFNSYSMRKKGSLESLKPIGGGGYLLSIHEPINYHEMARIGGFGKWNNQSSSQKCFGNEGKLNWQESRGLKKVKSAYDLGNTSAEVIRKSRFQKLIHISKNHHLKDFTKDWTHLGEKKGVQVVKSVIGSTQNPRDYRSSSQRLIKSSFYD